MTLTTNNKMELISWGYVHAVAACEGIQLVRTMIDDDSVDGTFVLNEGRCPRVDFQLKATHAKSFNGNILSFPLPKKNYSELRKLTMSPRILIVVAMPDKEDEWLMHDHDALLLRNCAYWKSLANAPDKANTTSVTVDIEKQQPLSPKSLRALMEKAADPNFGGML